MNTCPITTGPDWKKLLGVLGNSETWRLYAANDEIIPDLKDVEVAIPNYKNLLIEARLEIEREFGFRVVYGTLNEGVVQLLTTKPEGSEIVVDTKGYIDMVKYPSALKPFIEEFAEKRGKNVKMDAVTEEDKQTRKEFYLFIRSKGVKGLSYGRGVVVLNEQSYNNNRSKLRGYLGVKHTRTTVQSMAIPNLKRYLNLTLKEYSLKQLRNRRELLKKYNADNGTEHILLEGKGDTPNTYTIELGVDPRYAAFTKDGRVVSSADTSRQNKVVVKEGVSELFESNPELANAVYETLGFNENNFELKENKEAFGKEPHPEGATSYDIFSNSRKIGKIALFDGKNPMIKGLELNESERNKGLGKALYKWLNYKATLKGGRLYADQEFISPDAQRVWESLNKEGLVDLTGNSPKFNDKQKQQAQQLYSQYLDTIFPDSKVKDIVYHKTKEKFESFDKSKLISDGFYFTPDITAYKHAGNIVISVKLNFKNPITDAPGISEGINKPGDTKRFSDIGYDSIIDIEGHREYIAFEPEQIHILGSKQDIEGFKKFTESKEDASTLYSVENKPVFKLTTDKLGKDQGKADLANAFIGYGVEGTSTAAYLDDAIAQGIPANDQIQPNDKIVAFVSVNGNNKLTPENEEKTLNSIKAVLDAGGTVIMDSSYDAGRVWNRTGEYVIQLALGTPSGYTTKGYNYWGKNPENIDPQAKLHIDLYDALLPGFADYYEQKEVVDILYSAILNEVRSNKGFTVYVKGSKRLSETDYNNLPAKLQKGYKPTRLDIPYKVAYTNVVNKIETLKDSPKFKNNKIHELIRLNKKELLGLVLTKLHNLGIVGKSNLSDIDLETVFNISQEDLLNESGGAIDINTWVDGWVFKFDAKNNAAREVKFFMSTLPKLTYSKEQNINIKVESVLDPSYPVYYTYDEVFDVMKALLTDTDNTWNSFQKKLEDNRLVFPAVDSVLLALNNYKGDKERLIHQLVRTLTSTPSNEKTFLFRDNSDDQNTDYHFKAIDTDRSSLINAKLEEWSDSFENESPLVNAEGGKNIEKITAYKEKIDIAKNEAVDFFRYWMSIKTDKSKLDKSKYNNLKTKINELLTDLGITVSDETLDAFILTRFGEGKEIYKKTIVEQFTTKYGLFQLVKNKLDSSLLDTDEDVASFNPINGGGERNSSILALAGSEATLNPTVVSTSYINGKGDIVQSYSLTKFIANELKKFKTDKHYTDSVLETVFNQVITVEGETLYNSWLHRLNTDEAIKDLFEIGTIDTLKEDRKGAKGKEMTELTEAEFEALRINNILTTNYIKKGEEKIINHIFVVPSKTTSYTIKGIGLDFELIQRNGGYRLPPKALNALLAPALSEYKRIKYSSTATINNKAYREGSKKFFFYPFLNKETSTGAPLWAGNTLLELTTKITSSVTGQETTVEQEIKDLILDNFKSAVQKTILEWTDLGLIKNDKLKVNNNYLASHKGKTDKELINQAVAEYLVNSILANYNMHQMFIGDPALYFKTNVRATWDTVEKRLASMIAPYISLSLTTGTEKLATVKLADFKTRAYNHAQLTARLGDLAKPYNSINSTDAQEYTTVREYLWVEYRLGNIPTDTYNNLVAKINEKGDDVVFTPEELKYIFNVHKPVYSGSKINTGARYVEKHYIKSSALPLVPQFTKGLELDKVRRSLEKLEKDINKDSSEFIGVRAAYESAVKVGGADPVDVWNTTEDPVFTEITYLDRANFGIQQELPNKESQEVTRSTQVTKQLLDGLLSVGNFKLREEQVDENGETKNVTKTYTGEQLYKKYLELHSELFKKGLDSVLKELVDPATSMVDKTKLAATLKQQLIDRNASSAQIEALDIIAGDFAQPLWASTFLSQVQPIITSIFTNNILKKPMHGKSYVLVSDAGFGGKSEDIIYFRGGKKVKQDLTDQELLEYKVPSTVKDKEVAVTNIDPKTGEETIEKEKASTAVEDIKKQYKKFEELLQCLNK